jgi:ribose-phosphate pyrophosphokinase
VDDIIATGKTLARDADALLGEGATRVSAAATHAVFADSAVELLRASKLHQVVVTDTTPRTPAATAWEAQGGLRVLSLAPLLADAVLRVHEDRSVSELFRDRSLELFR